MGTLKPFVIILTLLISSLAGCLDSTESDEPVERTEHIHVECFGVVETNPECDIDFSVGRGIEPMISSKILSELESNDYDDHRHDEDHSHEDGISSIDYSPNYFYSVDKPSSNTSGRSHAQTPSECTSQDLIGLTEQDLETYLVTHTHGCLYNSVVLPLDANTISVFTDENIVWIANKIEEIAPLYDGDNSEGIFQLMFFIHEAYYHEWYGQIDEFDQSTTDEVFAAINAIKMSPHILDSGEESRKITEKLIGLADTVDAQALVLSLYVEILETFPSEPSFYEINNYGLPSYTQRTVSTVLISIHRSAHYTDVNAHAEIFDLLAGVAEISTDEEITNNAEVIVNQAMWAFARFAYTTPPYSEIYYWTSVNDMYDLACEYLIEAENYHYSQDDYSLPYLWALTTHDSFYTVPHEDRCVNEINDYTIDEIIPLLEEQLFPNTYSFDDGRIQINTPLDEDEAISLYYSIKEVQAQYFRITESLQPVIDDPNHELAFMIYGSKEEYHTWQYFIYGLNSNNGGIYIEQWGRVFTYQRTPEESIYTLDELVRHEYVHYLDGRYMIEEMWGENDFYDNGRLTWFNEGLAEFLVGSSNRDGIMPREIIVEQIQNDGSNRMSVEEIFNSDYGSGFKFYRYSAVLIDYVYHEHNYKLRNLFECVSQDDSTCFDLITEALVNDNNFEEGYQLHIDEMLSQLSSYVNPEPSYVVDDNLDALETEYVENHINSIGESEYSVECDPGVRTLLPRHRCIGTLHLNETEDSTTENSWQHFDRRLNQIMHEIHDSGDERYTEGMVCWFDRILIEETIRDRYNHSTSFHCEIPLKIGQYNSDGILAHLEEDVNRTRANDSIDCRSAPSETDLIFICKINVFSAWFEYGTEQEVLLESLEMYSLEIGNQIHASNPNLYDQSHCFIDLNTLEYHEIDSESLTYASAILECQFLM